MVTQTYSLYLSIAYPLFLFVLTYNKPQWLVFKCPFYKHIKENHATFITKDTPLQQTIKNGQQCHFGKGFLEHQKLIGHERMDLCMYGGVPYMNGSVHAYMDACMYVNKCHSCNVLYDIKSSICHKHPLNYVLGFHTSIRFPPNAAQCNS